MGATMTWIRRFSAAAMLLAAACAGAPNDGGGGGGGTDSGMFPMSRVGETYLDEQIVLREIRSPAEGTGETTFVVENTGDQIDDVALSVIFYSPPTGRRTWDSDRVDLSRNIFPGLNEISAAPTIDPSLVRGYELKIESLTTVSGASAGTEYIDGTLRCVEMEKDLTADERKLSFRLLNTSDQPVEPPQYKVMFRRGGKKIAETELMSLDATIAPGGDVLLAPDLSGIAVDLGGSTVQLVVQRYVL